MSPFLQFAFVLMIIILSAKAAGLLSIRFGQPSVLGELLVGLLLGPTLIDIAHLPFITNTHLTETIVELGELGVLLLMFMAGLELHLEELTRNSRVAGLAGSLGVLVPVGLGVGLGLFFDETLQQAIFLGLILGATSVSISAQTLMELKVLRSRVGLGLLGAAVFDDVLVILLVSIALAVTSGAVGILPILFILLRMVGFLVGAALFGAYALPWLTRRANRLPISQPILSLALVILLAFGIAAEVLGGMAAITGAFVAGLFFARTPEKRRMERGLRALSYSLFVPIFFISIGLNVNLREIGPSALLLLVGMSLLGIVGKLLGAGLGALWGGFTPKESLQLGAGMVSRGEVGLIVANIGVTAGLVSADGLSAALGMVIITTLVTPPMLRSLFKGKPATPPADEPAPRRNYDAEADLDDED